MQVYWPERVEHFNQYEMWTSSPSCGEWEGAENAALHESQATRLRGEEEGLEHSLGNWASVVIAVRQRHPLRRSTAVAPP